jgi:hypothetical protein
MVETDRRTEQGREIESSHSHILLGATWNWFARRSGRAVYQVREPAMGVPGHLLHNQRLFAVQGRRRASRRGLVRIPSQDSRGRPGSRRSLAWLLAQRAVHAEEMELEEALAEPLAEIDVCMKAAGHDNPDLPPRLSDLLGRSHLLYVRVARLDQLARRAL